MSSQSLFLGSQLFDIEGDAIWLGFTTEFPEDTESEVACMGWMCTLLGRVRFDILVKCADWFRDFARLAW